MVKKKCKHPKFDVIVCCQGQPFHYYHSTLIGALVKFGYQYLKNKRHGYIVTYYILDNEEEQV